MNCVICGIRKARRACPGIGGDICTICCAREREKSIDCPFSCEYLREAHLHEKPVPPPDAEMPHPGFRIDEEFFRSFQWVFVLMGSAVVDVFRKSPATTDHDVREALESLERTYETEASGLYYESKPINPFARAIFDLLRERIAALQKEFATAGEAGLLPDSAVLELLKLMRQIERVENNGRRYSRVFIDTLDRNYAPPPEGAVSAEPAAPLIIL